MMTVPDCGFAEEVVVELTVPLTLAKLMAPKFTLVNCGASLGTGTVHVPALVPEAPLAAPEGALEELPAIGNVTTY